VGVFTIVGVLLKPCVAGERAWGEEQGGRSRKHGGKKRVSGGEEKLYKTSGVVSLEEKGAELLSEGLLREGGKKKNHS